MVAIVFLKNGMMTHKLSSNYSINQFELPLHITGTDDGQEELIGQDDCSSDTSQNYVGVVLQLVSLSIIMVVSILCNAIVFYIFYRRPSLLTTSNRFVLNLAVANTCLSAFVMPLAFITSLLRTWDPSGLVCDLLGTLTSLFIISCIFSILLIAVDRLYAVTKALRYHAKLTRRRALVLVIISWIVASLVASLPFVGLNSHVFNSTTRLCTVNWAGTRIADRIYTILFVILCFIIPYMFMLLAYVVMFRATQKSTALARRNSITPDHESMMMTNGSVQYTHNGNQNNGNVYLPRRPSSSLLVAMRRRSSTINRAVVQRALHRDDHKAARTSLLVMSSFTLTWLPYFLVIVLQATLEKGVPGLFQVLALWLALAGTALNPLVYVFRNVQIKTELLRLFGYQARPSKPRGLERSSTQGSFSRDVLDGPRRKLGTSFAPEQFRSTPNSFRRGTSNTKRSPKNATNSRPMFRISPSPTPSASSSGNDEDLGPGIPNNEHFDVIDGMKTLEKVDGDMIPTDSIDK